MGPDGDMIVYVTVLIAARLVCPGWLDAGQLTKRSLARALREGIHGWAVLVVFDVLTRVAKVGEISLCGNTPRWASS